MRPLSYDFDMFSIFSDEIFADPKMRGMLKDAGITARMAGNRIALFRDQRTAEALRAAPQPIRDWLRASGFGENFLPSGIPPGHYRASDEQERLQIMQRLTDNLSKFPLPKAGSPEALAAEFKLAEFLANLTTAVPMADAVIDAALRARQPAPRKARRATTWFDRLHRRVFQGVLLVAVVFAVSGLVGDRIDLLATSVAATGN
jgi:hypothetical protein